MRLSSQKTMWPRAALPTLWLSILLLLISTTLVVRNVNADDGNTIECVDGTAAGGQTTMIWKDKVEPIESSNWNIEYFNTYKVLYNYASNTTYLLYQCGSSVPTSTSEKQYDAIIQIPVQRVGVTQTPTLTYLEQLDQRNKIILYLSDINYVSSPCLRDLVASGRVATYADPTNTSSAIIFQGGASDDDSLKNTLNDDSNLVVFANEYDILPLPTLTNPFEYKPVIVTEYYETTNAAYFEWIKYYSVFFNAESIANQVVDQANERFTCIADNAAANSNNDIARSDANSSSNANATNTNDPPIVLWGYYSDYCGGWDVGECNYTIAGDGNYYCEYADACGVRMLPLDGESVPVGSVNATTLCGATLMSTTELVEYAKNADYWIYNSANWDTIYQNFTSELQEMKSIKDQNVFDYQGSGDDAWFEQRIAEYYNVLQDFCYVAGQRTVGLANRHWFRNVFTEKVGTRLDTCTPSTASNILTDGYVCESGGNGAVYNSNESSTGSGGIGDGSGGSSSGDLSNNANDGSGNSSTSDAAAPGSSNLLLAIIMLSLAAVSFTSH